MSKDTITGKSILDRLRRMPGGNEWIELMESFPKLDVFVAGGCVRDEFLQRGSLIQDFDFFIGGEAVENTLSFLEEAGQLSHGPFGSPRWHPLVANMQVYHDVIPIERFYNGLWRCMDVVDVLNQFDFTANAVALDLRTYEFYDPQNGRRDIQNRVMRAVRFDYPDSPISTEIELTRLEVVWFRILHYAAELGLTIEPVTLAWLNSRQDFAEHFKRFEALFFPLNNGWKRGLV